MSKRQHPKKQTFIRRWIIKGTVTLLIPLVTLWPIQPSQAADLTPEQLYAAAAPAVVVVHGNTGKTGMSGAGSIIRADGLVLTNAHVVIEKNTGVPYKHIWVALKPDRLTGDFHSDLKQRFSASVQTFDRDLDLAVVKITQPPLALTVLKLGDAEKVNIGAQVVAIGHPEQGGLWSLTTGVISAHLANLGNVAGKDVFQTEASMNRGNSGGPLINTEGQQIGVNTAIARRAKDGLTITDVNFALKSSVAQKWLGEKGIHLTYAKVASLSEKHMPRTESTGSLESSIKHKQRQAPETEKDRKTAKKESSRGESEPGFTVKDQPERAPELPPQRPYNLDQLSKWFARAEKNLVDLAEEARRKIRAQRQRDEQASRIPSPARNMKAPGTTTSPTRDHEATSATHPAPKSPSMAMVGEPPEEQLDCTVYETKSIGFTLGFKLAGAFLFSVGPEIGVTHKSGVAWDKVVHGTIARYVELCNRYNAGMVNKAEYEARLHEIERLYKEALELEAKLFAATRQRSRSGFDELDREVGKVRQTPSSKEAMLENKVERLARRIEQLDPIGRPLMPTKPCPPPDMLGAPGAKPDLEQKC